MLLIDPLYSKVWQDAEFEKVNGLLAPRHDEVLVVIHSEEDMLGRVGFTAHWFDYNPRLDSYSFIGQVFTMRLDELNIPNRKVTYGTLVPKGHP